MHRWQSDIFQAQLASALESSRQLQTSAPLSIADAKSKSAALTQSTGSQAAKTASSEPTPSTPITPSAQNDDCSCSPDLSGSSPFAYLKKKFQSSRATKAKSKAEAKANVQFDTEAKAEG